MMHLRIVGDAMHSIPCPPPVIVRSSRTDAGPSPDAKRTTGGPDGPVPEIVVTAAPPEPLTVIALARKSMLSWYTPGATSTVSPDPAAAIAAWIVGCWEGTCRIA
jgi:hypothetical protein